MGLERVRHKMNKQTEEMLQPKEKAWRREEMSRRRYDVVILQAINWPTDSAPLRRVNEFWQENDNQ